MADITVAEGTPDPITGVQRATKFKDMGDGTHARVVAAARPTDVTVEGTAGQVAIFGADNALGGDAGLTYADSKLTAPAVVLGGTTGFEFVESSPGVLQLGDANVGVDSGVLKALGGIALALDGVNLGSLISPYSGALGGYGISLCGGQATIDPDLSTVSITNLYADGSVTAKLLKTDPVALAALGSAATAGAGTRAMISDGLNMGTWGATAADGGSTVKPVFSNGTNWLNG